MKNKTSFHKFMDATQGVKIEMASVDQLDSELKSNRVALQSTMAKAKSLKAEIETLRESYAYLAGQYDSMKKAALTIGDSNLTDRLVKALNEANSAYNDINKLYQKF